MAKPAGASRYLARLGTLPVAATVLTAIAALYYLLVAFTNWTDFGTNQAFVHHVFEMDTTFRDPDLTWRAVNSDGLQNVAYVGVIVWESLIALVLVWATVQWVRGLRGGGFDAARRWATLGFVMVFVLFFGGFITVGGEFFAMWQSDTWNGLQPALQNTLLAGLGLIVTQLPSPQWSHWPDSTA
jgi:predicted small integral membrane protein